ncbi:hypothetical protein SLEP1_g1799 [Rubroshorea leprosula]|uniref:Uncharacterized protein n=1 Tax=Rubroshorea leprosula TaxID=152421 RepID=A0AAV5HF10_9ROSI|nr:hypothetical protein SLEP1_g1799 [Rubroshorea leprosula]
MVRNELYITVLRAFRYPISLEVLLSKDFVPNVTLHRLINLLAQSSTGRPESESSAVLEEVVKFLMEKIERPLCLTSWSLSTLVKIMEDF